MEKVRIDEVENSLQPAAVMRPLTDALGATDLAINYYELEPGDSFAFAYHSHEIQEEVFYVQEGTATFETEDGPVEVAGGEVVRFGPEEFQRGWNRSDERVRALALGAPLEYGTQPKLRYCPDCEEETDNRLARTDDDAAVVAYCERCGAETGRWYEGSMDGEVP
ncbi:cupin domain-containing protein [Halapricum hydrolyticum]|uniref:Cupin domain-containing protein n=1 Tax=Halapricum hydrolyticum TaxID=2979991 RepID=A0AAE3IFF4_9EURY|nr:cupin domain-containing protein [Halapricum hydrolyticum]MCU4718107.1 cupin domain-containing protein [Halapricum hydrolyticum]MCU4727385.1 cupin domain-containing protein [Halapricum hydrolyticum]